MNYYKLKNYNKIKNNFIYLKSIDLYINKFTGFLYKDINILNKLNKKDLNILNNKYNIDNYLFNLDQDDINIIKWINEKI